jgi:hypothetical protein
MADRVYSKEEAEAILARAIELHGHGDATSHAELVATARELGVAPEAIEQAAAEVLDRRRDDAALRALRARQWRGFYAHLVPYVSVGLFLGFLNFVTGGFPWALIPMLGWAIGLASHLLVVAMPDEEKLRRRVERERERARRREEKRSERSERREPRELPEPRDEKVRVGPAESGADVGDLSGKRVRELEHVGAGDRALLEAHNAEDEVDAENGESSRGASRR